MPTLPIILKVKCPRCGKEEIIDTSRLKSELEVTGLHNFSFIHEDHIFTVYVDSHNFIRGAYIKPIHYATDSNCFFDDYYVLTRVVVGHKFRFVAILKKKKIIDIRAFPELITNLHYFLKSLLDDTLDKALIDYKIIKYCTGDVCLYGVDLGKHSKKWLKLLGKIIDTMGTLPNTALKQVLSYIDQNYDREPKKDDYEYITKIVGESKEKIS